MLGTFFLTVVFDLTVAVEVGLALACVLFVRRMGALFRAELMPASAPETETTANNTAAPARPRLVWQLHGALFFGAMAKIDPLVQTIESGPAGAEVVLDMGGLFALDTTGLDGLEQVLKAVGLRGGVLRLQQAQEQPRSLMERSGFVQRVSAQNALHEASPS